MRASWCAVFTAEFFAQNGAGVQDGKNDQAEHTDQHGRYHEFDDRESGARVRVKLH